jgi:hypothetical protein
MNKVYIVCETIDGEKTYGGAHLSYKAAREHAESIAEYASVEEAEKDFWGDDEYNCITIDEVPLNTDK